MKTLPAPGISARPENFLARFIHPFAGLLLKHLAPAADLPARRSVLPLARGKVRPVHRRDGIAEIRVLSGIVWLTTTPAQGDIILRAADRFTLPPTGTVVLEALQDATVALIQNRPQDHLLPAATPARVRTAEARGS